MKAAVPTIVNTTFRFSSAPNFTPRERDESFCERLSS
jgi:hypothetical protein